MKRRSYRGEEDVARLQAFNARAVAENGYAGYLHVGDIPHRMFNALRFEDVRRLLHVWEDTDGEIVAWALVYPPNDVAQDPPLDPAFDLQVRADVRSVDLEVELVRFLIADIEAMCKERDATSCRIIVDAFQGDSVRAAAAERCGFTSPRETYALTAQAIDRPRDVVLPPGYVIRSVVSLADAPGLASVHAASFGSNWTAERYEWLMTTPGYDPERELVAVAPDGSFAAFAVMWFDHVNATGLFEPVGTAADHRRRGLGRAMLDAGMQRMAKAGLKTAMVAHGVDNVASTELYARAGFRPIAKIDEWARPSGPR